MRRNENHGFIFLFPEIFLFRVVWMVTFSFFHLYSQERLQKLKKKCRSKKEKMCGKNKAANILFQKYIYIVRVQIRKEMLRQSPVKLFLEVRHERLPRRTTAKYQYLPVKIAQIIIKENDTTSARYSFSNRKQTVRKTDAGESTTKTGQDRTS